LREDGAEEDGGAADVAKKKGDEEQPENAAVKNRRENVSGLDQIFDQAAKRCDGDRNDAPAEGQPARRDDIVVIGGAGAEDAVPAEGPAAEPAPALAGAPAEAPAGLTVPAGMTGRAGPRAVRVVTIFAACCFAAGAIASQQAFASATMAAAARSYVATARAALAHAPRGTVIVDGATPGSVMNPAFFPAGTADTSRVVGPLTGRPGAAARLRWVPALDGVYAAPMIFDAKGRLRPVTVTGLRSKEPPPAARNPAAKNTSGKNTPACWNVTNAATSIPLGGTLYRWPWMVRLAYTGPAGRLSVRFGPGEARSVVLPAGSHLAYLPLTGSGNAVSARLLK